MLNYKLINILAKIKYRFNYYDNIFQIMFSNKCS